MKSTSGWEQLICEYFYSTSVKVLGKYFANIEFFPQKTKINGVLFRKGNVYIEVSYIPETSPRYSPSLVVGFGEDKYDEVGKPTGVPAWSVLSDDDDARRFSFWNFSSELELESLLEKMKDEIIEIYIRPLWEDEAKLTSAVAKFIGELK